jgi:hypothetical protein
MDQRTTRMTQQGARPTWREASALGGTITIAGQVALGQRGHLQRALPAAIVDPAGVGVWQWRPRCNFPALLPVIADAVRASAHAGCSMRYDRAAGRMHVGHLHALGYRPRRMTNDGGRMAPDAECQPENDKARRQRQIANRRVSDSKQSRFQCEF